MKPLIEKNASGHYDHIDQAFEHPGEYSPSDTQKIVAARTAQLFAATQKDALSDHPPGGAPKVEPNFFAQASDIPPAADIANFQSRGGRG